MTKKVEYSESGSPIIRYEEVESEFQAPDYGDDFTIKKLEDHYDKYLGETESVFHEIISDIVHIDVHWIKPSSTRPFHTLVTTGMSYLPMNVPDECEEFKFAELMICLPPSWPLTEEAFKDDNNYWPIWLLKSLARFPHEYNTWLGWGHSLPNGEPAEPYADNTKFCGVVLLTPITVDEEFYTLKVSEEKIINFYCLIPLYIEEMNCKLKKGSEALLDKFNKYNINDVIDINRKNVCKRSFWPFGKSLG